MKDTLDEYIEKSGKLLEQLDTLHHNIVIADRMVLEELNKVNKGEYQIDIEMVRRAIRALDNIISNTNRSLEYSLTLSERNVENCIRRKYESDSEGMLIK